MADPNDEELIKSWTNVRQDVKAAICQGFPQHDCIPPRYYGKIKVTPQYWEVMAIDKVSYFLSSRYSYVLSKGSWQEKKLAVIS